MDIPSTTAFTSHSFVYFPKLPKEIQLRIWRTAIWQRKVIVSLATARKVWGMRRLYSPKPGPPAVMHTCQDSRREASYRQAFRIAPFEQYLWVNFDYDTISIGDDMLRSIDATERESIRHVILNVAVTETFFMLHLPYVSEMRSVKDVVLLSDEDFSFWGMSLRRVERAFKDAFSQNPDWRCPKLKVIEKATGEEMSLDNIRVVARMSRGRAAGGRGSVRGRSDLGRGVRGG